MLVRRRIPTPSREGYDAVLAAVATIVREVGDEAGLDLASAPIGVGMPGNVTRAGLVKNSNTVCFNGRPFRVDLERSLGRAITFDNDANCFTLAEATARRLPRRTDEGEMFGVTLGTGVGGGLALFALHGHQGLHGIAGEWGHERRSSRVRGPLCYCGRRGCPRRTLRRVVPAVEKDYETRAGAHLRLAEIAVRRATDPHAAAAIDGLLAA